VWSQFGSGKNIKELIETINDGIGQNAFVRELLTELVRKNGPHAKALGTRDILDQSIPDKETCLWGYPHLLADRRKDAR
jgi:hypothetical protein